MIIIKGQSGQSEPDTEGGHGQCLLRPHWFFYDPLISAVCREVYLAVFLYIDYSFFSTFRNDLNPSYSSKGNASCYKNVGVQASFNGRSYIKLCTYDSPI